MTDDTRDPEMQQFQADLLESVRSMKAGRAARVTHVESAPTINLGSDFDDFLREEGIYGEVTATAMQRVRDWQAKQGSKD
jgi:putative transcriptional regulator